MQLPIIKSRPMEFLQYASKTNRVLLHPTRPKWLVTNPSAFEIVNWLFRGENSEQVEKRLSQKYGISRQIACQDVFQVKEALRGAGLLSSDSARLKPRVPEPRSLFLHLTHQCTLSCVHCYVGAAKSKVSANLPTDVVFALFDQMKAMGGRSVILSGGEPLLHPDVRSIILSAGSHLQIILLTNGTLINREWAEILAGQGVRVQVSIDGSCPAVHDAIRGKGSFYKAVRAVEVLQKAGLSEKINIATTVMSQNLDDLPEIMYLAEQLGIPSVRFLPLRKLGTAVAHWAEIGEGLNKNDAENFYDYVIHRGQDGTTRPEVTCGLSGFMLTMPDETDDDIWCPLGRQLTVDVDGSAYPCAAMMTPEFRLGSVFTETVKDLFSSTPMETVCRALVERRQEIDHCAACTWRNLCQSGCMALALEHKGTIWDTDNFCEYRKKLYEEAFDRILALQEDG